MRRVVERVVAAVSEELVFPPSTLDNPRVVRGDSVRAVLDVNSTCNKAGEDATIALG